VTAGTLSLRGLARLLGVDDKAVRKALEAGVFSDGAVRRDETGRPAVLNATLAVDEWQKSGRQLRGSDRRSAPAVPVQTSAQTEDVMSPDRAQVELKELLAQLRRQVSSPGTAAETPGVPSEDLPPQPSSPTYVKAQTETMLERGRQLRMENDLRAGLLIEADKAATEAFDFARTLRENILNIPARLAAELAAESDAGIVHRRLEDALREALESTARTLDAAPAGDRGRGELVAV